MGVNELPGIPVHTSTHAVDFHLRHEVDGKAGNERRSASDRKARLTNIRLDEFPLHSAIAALILLRFHFLRVPDEIGTIFPFSKISLLSKQARIRFQCCPTVLKLLEQMLNLTGKGFCLLTKARWTGPNAFVKIRQNRADRIDILFARDSGQIPDQHIAPNQP